MKKPKHILIAERNALELVDELRVAMKFMDGLSTFGNAVTHEYVGKREFFDGLGKIRSALFAEYCYALSRAMPFAWRDGSAAQAFSKKFMLDRMGGQFETASFLEHWCQLPGAYDSAATDALEAEVKAETEDPK